MHMTWKQLCVHIFDIVTVIDLISSLVFILMFPMHFFFVVFLKEKNSLILKRVCLHKLAHALVQISSPLKLLLK